MRLFGRSVRPGDAVLFLAVAAQIALLLLFNLLRTRYVVNMDSSEYLVQAIQIWRQKTLLIADYTYSTMLAWDIPTLPAALFYGITGNIYLAWGLSVDLFILLFLWTAVRIMNALAVSLRGKLLSLLAIFTVYHYGTVEYWDELFINGALYLLRITVVLLLADVLLRLFRFPGALRGRERILCIAESALCCLFSFVCGLSTGIFIIGCGIAPLFLWQLHRVLFRNESLSFRAFFNPSVFLSLGALASAFLGVAVCRLIGLSDVVSTTKLTVEPSVFAQHALNLFTGFLQLFGWPTEPVSLTSIAGLFAIASFFLSALYLFLAVFFLVRSLPVRRDASAGTESPSAVRREYAGMLFWILAVNLVLFLTADLNYSGAVFEYRYWLMFITPAMLSFGALYDDFHGCAEKPVSHHVRIIALLTVLALCAINLYRHSALWKETGLYDSRRQQLMNLAGEQGMDFVYVYGDFFSGRVACTMVPGSLSAAAAVDYGLSDNGSDWESGFRMPHWGTYTRYDGDLTEIPADLHYGILLMKNGTLREHYDFLKARARSSVTTYESVDDDLFGYELLDMGNEPHMDFVQGVPTSGRSISKDELIWGYDAEGLVQGSDGCLISDGQTEGLVSAAFTAEEDGRFRFTLQGAYANRPASSAVLRVCGSYDEDAPDENVFETADAADSGAAVLEQTLRKDCTYRIEIRIPAGTVYSPKELVMERL